MGEPQINKPARSLADLKSRSEKIAEREQNLIIFSAIVFPIAEKISELWAAQLFLQPIPFKSDRLLEPAQVFFAAANKNQAACGRIDKSSLRV